MKCSYTHFEFTITNEKKEENNNKETGTAHFSPVLVQLCGSYLPYCTDFLYGVNRLKLK